MHIYTKMCLPGCKMSLFFCCCMNSTCSLCIDLLCLCLLFHCFCGKFQIFFFFFFLARLVWLFFDQISFARLHLRELVFACCPPTLVPTPSQCVFGTIKRLEQSRAQANSQSKIKFYEENSCNWPTLEHSRKKNSTDCINADGKDILLCIIIHTECTGNISKAHTAVLLLEIYFCSCSAEVSGEQSCD